MIHTVSRISCFCWENFQPPAAVGGIGGAASPRQQANGWRKAMPSEAARTPLGFTLSHSIGLRSRRERATFGRAKDKEIKHQREDSPLVAGDAGRAEQHRQDQRAWFRDTGDAEPDDVVLERRGVGGAVRGVQGIRKPCLACSSNTKTPGFAKPGRLVMERLGGCNPPPR
jgi:hypothetical protein